MDFKQSAVGMGEAMNRFRCKLCGIILMPYFNNRDCSDSDCPQSERWEDDERPTARVRTEDERLDDPRHEPYG